jgi:uncharacterized protein (DUF427 family)
MPKAIWNGAVIAESEDTVKVEGNHYFPLDSVKREYLVESDTHTVCPWKGVASYYTLEVNLERNADAAWHYPHPTPLARKIRGRVAFWHGRPGGADRAGTRHTQRSRLPLPPPPRRLLGSAGVAGYNYERFDAYAESGEDEREFGAFPNMLHACACRSCGGSRASCSSSAPSPDRTAPQRVLYSTSSHRSTRRSAGTSSIRARRTRASSCPRTNASRTSSPRRGGCATSSASDGRSSSTTSTGRCTERMG